MFSDVRTNAGTPPVGAFACATGTPLIIDTNAAIAYYLSPANVVTPLSFNLALITINTQTASYSIVAADCAPSTPTLIKMNVAGANTLTYPLNATIPIPIGSVVGWVQYGAGQITHTPAGGVTLRNSSSLTSRAQYSSGTALKIGTDEWLIEGDTT